MHTSLNSSHFAIYSSHFATSTVRQVLKKHANKGNTFYHVFVDPETETCMQVLTMQVQVQVKRFQIIGSQVQVYWNMDLIQSPGPESHNSVDTEYIVVFPHVATVFGRC